MLYFKHAELAEKYHVSLKTVHNWIDAAKQGKISLVLHKKDNRTYVANNPANIIALDQLVQERKKYRNARFHKTVTPDAEFYKLYTKRQILEIISNLSIHHEIPRKYNYMDGGAASWDSWLKRLEKEQSPNTLKGTVDLLHANLGALDLLTKPHKRINVVDVGAGNARPTKELLEHLLEQGVLHRYIAIDISEAMLEIAKNNIERWFGDRVKFEGYIRDIAFERFDDLLVDDMLNKEADNTINLVLLLGSTPVNFPSFTDPIKLLQSSMSADDLLVYTCKPDTEASRQYFLINQQTDEEALSPKYRLMLDLMNINATLYDVEMGFNSKKRMRYIRIRLKSALTIKFKFENGTREVHFEKGDTILMLRAWHLSTLEIVSEFEKCGLMLLHASMTRDREYLLTVSGVDMKTVS